MKSSASIINHLSLASVVAIAVFGGLAQAGPGAFSKLNVGSKSHQQKEGDDVLEKNKKIVVVFYELAFNQFQPVEAAKKFLKEDYIQHNPRVADGRQGFIDAFAGSAPDEGRTLIKRVMAEDDLVILHSHFKQNAQDLGVAVVDIFRVSGDLITEHWDVGQKVPEKSKNNNTMF